LFVGGEKPLLLSQKRANNKRARKIEEGTREEEEGLGDGTWSSEQKEPEPDDLGTKKTPTGTGAVPPKYIGIELP
jgi:hypothetical protein